MAQQTLSQHQKLDTMPRSQSRRPRLKVGRLFLYLLVVTLCVIFGFPLFWTLMSSLKTSVEMFAYPPVIIPAVPQWNNYVDVMTLDRIQVVRWFWNSVFIVTLATAGTLFSASLVAYSFARFDYRGRNVLFFITLATMMLPTQVTLRNLDNGPAPSISAAS